MELDRHFIERRDFPAARRGYDPDEVDRHLSEIAEAVAELKRTQKPTPASLAGAAAEQVRTIVEAAEASAATIQERAEQEARRITEDAARRARETRQSSEAEAASHVERVEDAARNMLERANSIDSEIDDLLGNLRTTAQSLVDELRSGASSLQSDLGEIRAGVSEIRGERQQAMQAGVGEPEAAAEPSFDDGEGEPEFGFEPAGATATEAGPVDADPEVVSGVRDTVGAEYGGDRGVEVEDYAAEEEEEEAAPPEPAAPEPAMAEGQTEAPRAGAPSSTRSIGGAEGARLIALNMALNGTPRDETARYLEQNFELDDQDALLDEVYARVGG